MFRVKSTLLVLCGLLSFILIPDLLFSIFNSNYQAGFDLKSNLVTVVMIVFLLLSRADMLNRVILILFAVMQATQMMYFQYSGSFYSAFDMVLMVTEIKDVMIAFTGDFLFMLPALLISISFFSAAYFIYSRYHSTSFSLPYTWVLLILLVSLPFLQSLRSETSQKFQPNIAHSAIKNGLYSLSYFGSRQIKILAGIRNPMPKYSPYVVNEVNPVNANIVVLMGESLTTFNMGLFGYKRKTTPSLNQYKGSSDFFYIPTISSGVSTQVSLSLFFNTIYEPNNISKINKMDTALFKLAKKSGFNTHYITTQENAGGMTYSFSMADIDTWKDDSDLSKHKSNYDDRLLLELDSLNLDYNKPQFITLQMRSAHALYVDNYPESQGVYPLKGLERKEFLINSYDNAIVYTDKVITDLYKYFEATNRPTYIFFVSDHGELFGQFGRYGHNYIALETANTPFLFYGIGIGETEVNRLKTEFGCLSNHYLISLQIAALLGYEIFNPNEIEDQYYLNGTDVFGEAGYMKYDLRKLRGTMCTGNKTEVDS